MGSEATGLAGVLVVQGGFKPIRVRDDKSFTSFISDYANLIKGCVSGY